jgi:hypothetical protein
MFEKLTSNVNLGYQNNMNKKEEFVVHGKLFC